MLEIYTKHPTTFDQQLKLLKVRGVSIDDEEIAHFYLRTTNYFRLSTYRYPFLKIEQDGVISDDFEAGTQFKDVIKLYEFDRRLRLQVMDAIERIEVYMRAIFAELNLDTFAKTEELKFSCSDLQGKNRLGQSHR